MRTKLFSWCLPVLCAVIFPQAAQAAMEGGIWHYDDADGVAHFSNIPDGTSPYRLYLKDPGAYRLKGTGDKAAPVASRKSSASLLAGLDKLPYADLVASAASTHQLEPALLHAIIQVESRHNPAAVSPKGAIGLMQVLPETARNMGVADARTPEQNIAAGARYMRLLIDTFGSDMQLALAAYNAGQNAVIRHGYRIPPYPETQAYVPAVMDVYRALRGK